MIKLFIIADDFTGALDTGVQFAAQGACTRVITDPAADLRHVDPEVEVLVIDAETRHLSAGEAYDVVYRVVKQASEIGIPYIYKKTDSALRGNIGAELTALLSASGRKQLPFLPAFPQMNRCTVDGVHYIGDVPVAKSVFGQDPFEPVTESSVTKLIALQSDVQAISCQISETGALAQTEGIVVFDARSEEELALAGKRLHDAGSLHIMAGCAGFGAVLPKLLGLAAPVLPKLPKLDPRLLVLCGSVNPITVSQLEWARKNGFASMRMTPHQKLTPGYFESEAGKAQILDWKKQLAACSTCIIDTNDEGGNEPTAQYTAEHGLTIEDVRQGISRALGQIMKQLFDCPDLGTLLITGGDTLLQCMNQMGVYEVEPIGEMAKGVVLSRFTLNGCSRFVITKSGGFGCETLMTDLVAMIRKDERTVKSAD